MRFLADINIPQSIIQELLIAKHDVLDAKRILLAASDIKLIEIARKEERIILTRDKDFIVLSQYPKHQIPAIVLRSKNQKPQNLLN